MRRVYYPHRTVPESPLRGADRILSEQGGAVLLRSDPICVCGRLLLRPGRTRRQDPWAAGLCPGDTRYFSVL